MQKYISLSHKSLKQILIPVSNIQYITSKNKWSKVVYTDGHIYVRISLRTFQDNFPSIFLNIHRNTLISKQHIRSIIKIKDFHILTLNCCKKKFEISRRRLPGVKKYFKKYNISN